MFVASFDLLSSPQCLIRINTSFMSLSIAFMGHPTTIFRMIITITNIYLLSTHSLWRHREMRSKLHDKGFLKKCSLLIKEIIGNVCRNKNCPLTWYEIIDRHGTHYNQFRVYCTKGITCYRNKCYNTFDKLVSNLIPIMNLHDVMSLSPFYMFPINSVYGKNLFLE